ncbi:tRNA (guanosine(37)-N1)-methyltransferase TrmD [uncultured Desulfobacter sp.]|uniref:tRNA (guanosine(37)-N1)-methyltransferase TrmD n=1 Tax=uncultured Desulfobacter sp. TaxID=240139 RepID=UPI002AAAD6D7|nr:tRNA (guanosine(37)-N1)-methyltransferase TrmD [uncultured Desulfobacter sp.]
MKFTVLTLFPEFIDAFFANGIMARALSRGVISADTINIRDFTLDRHNSVDDRPYGGGSGMVMMPGPVEKAIESAAHTSDRAWVACLSPQGKPFTQARACELAATRQDLVLICGRYEGIDERVYARRVDEEICVGDFVMTGGEIAAMAVIDAVARMIPGVLGSDDSSQCESFMDNRLEYAQYTRPEVYEGMAVPGVLLSGNHEKIRQWRRRSALERTFIKRPDLFESRTPDDEEKEILRQWCRELEALIDK